MPLVAHQVEISLGQLAAFDDGTLDQCLAAKMTPMAWSPLGGGQFADGARRLLKYQEGYRTEGVLPLLDEYASTRRDAVRPGAGLAAETSVGHQPIVGSTNRSAFVTPLARRKSFGPRRMVSVVDRHARRAVAVRGCPAGWKRQGAPAT